MALRSLVGFLWNGTNDTNFGIADPNGKIASFEVDAVLSETHTMERDVTMNEVENGSPIADHIIKRPITLDIQAIVTDAPVKGLVENYSNAIDNLLNGSKYTADCFGALRLFYEHQDILTIYTEYTAYENMAIQSIVIARDPKDGEALVFNIRAVQIRIVETASTTLPAGMGVKADGTSNAKQEATAHRATPNKDVGKNTGADVDTNKGSILSQAFESGSKSIESIINKAKQAAAGVGQ